MSCIPRRAVVVLIFLAVGLCNVACAEAGPSLRISHPASGETVRGTYTFVALTTNPSTFVTVEFDLGSKRLGIATSPPFNVIWNTGYASDGSYALEVIGRNARGQIVATTQQPFIINNHANSLTVTSPDLTRPLSGIVRLTIKGSDRQYYPALWMVNIDGQDVADIWTDNTGQSADTVTAQLDTTVFSNGTHELYIGMYSDSWPAGKKADKSWHNWRGGFERVITFENGHARMGVAANYLHVYMQPGRQISLTCRLLFTDQTSAPCASPIYKSSNPRLVIVSPRGTVAAGAGEGFATITVTDESKSTEAYFWVKSNLNVPHFSGSGEMLNSYTRGHSLFVVAPISLQASDLSSNPDLLRRVREAGINAISQGFYSNPRKLDYSYDSWRKDYDTNVAPAWSFAARNHLHILATGDEVCRNIGGEAWWTLNWPAGKSAVQHAFKSLAASRVAISVDMVDEASMMWGATPTPPGLSGKPNSFTSISCSSGRCTVFWPNNPVNSSRFPSGTTFALTGSQNPGLNTPAGHMFSATNITSDSFDFSAPKASDGTFTQTNDPNLDFLWWAGNIGGCPSEPCNPPVPNDALGQITDWLHSVQPGVPISWPTLGLAPTSVQANWMGRNSISDYASHYWISFKLRPTYAWSDSIQEFGYWMRQAFYQRQPLMMLDRPQLILDSLSGPAYLKKAAGSPYYRPPEDSLDVPGVSGPVVTATMMTAAALGAAGVRLYFFENSNDAVNRSAARSGSYFQTGASPTANDSTVEANWQGMSSAANALTNPESGVIH
jgi:hypothetical protein